MKDYQEGTPVGITGGRYRGRNGTICTPENGPWPNSQGLVKVRLGANAKLNAPAETKYFLATQLTLPA